MSLTVGSFCTGIGGLDLAVEAHFGAELAWYSEVEPAPCTVLEREWPGVPNLGDLTALDWSQVEPVDILTAGYPCQPFSHAGKRKGQDDARHLWPFIAEAVRVLRPRWVVLENVAGHLTLGFGDVLRDLAEAGFDAEWCVLRASDVGAPHRRERIFIAASDAADGLHRHVGRGVAGSPSSGQRSDEGSRWGSPSRSRAPATDADGAGLEGRAAVSCRPGERPPRTGGVVAPADSNSGGLTLDSEPDGRRAGLGARRTPRRGDSDGCSVVAWGAFELAIRRWERLLGRPAPHPTDDRARLASPFVEWMMGYPEGWVDGLTRTQALKAIGNAVVPQQAATALAELVPLDVAA